MIERLLSFLFPLRVPSRVESFHPECIAGRHDPYFSPLAEDGILWVAYDVRRTGIEKAAAGDLWT
jgi:hypothetical protein